jgi:hypothetical protein
MDEQFLAALTEEEAAEIFGRDAALQRDAALAHARLVEIEIGKAARKIWTGDLATVATSSFAITTACPPLPHLECRPPGAASSSARTRLVTIAQLVAGSPTTCARASRGWTEHRR